MDNNISIRLLARGRESKDRDAGWNKYRVGWDCACGGRHSERMSGTEAGIRAKVAGGYCPRGDDEPEGLPE